MQTHQMQEEATLTQMTLILKRQARNESETDLFSLLTVTCLMT